MTEDKASYLEDMRAQLGLSKAQADNVSVPWHARTHLLAFACVWTRLGWAGACARL